MIEQMGRNFIPEPKVVVLRDGSVVVLRDGTPVVNQPRP